MVLTAAASLIYTTALSALTTFPTSSVNDSKTTTNSSTISDEERQRYLEQLQSETTIKMIPAMIFLCLLGLTGLIGNSLILFVYTQKFTWTPTRICIMAMAVFDLLTNVVAIPGDIYDMFHFWDFNHRALCRARRFFNSFTIISSAIILVAVAVVRYRRVCAPYRWQVSLKQAKTTSAMVAFLGSLFSVPYAITNGRQKKETPRAGIYGYQCTTDDSYVDTIWPLLNNGFFLLIFLSCLTPLVVLYTCIGIQAWKHRKRYGIPKAPVASMTPITPSSSCTMDPSSTHFGKSLTKSKRGPKKFEDSSKSTTNLVWTSDYSESAEDILHDPSTDDNTIESMRQGPVYISQGNAKIRTHKPNEIILKAMQTSDENLFVSNPLAAFEENDCQQCDLQRNLVCKDRFREGDKAAATKINNGIQGHEDDKGNLHEKSNQERALLGRSRLEHSKIVSKSASFPKFHECLGKELTCGAADDRDTVGISSIDFTSSSSVWSGHLEEHTVDGANAVKEVYKSQNLLDIIDCLNSSEQNDQEVKKKLQAAKKSKSFLSKTRSKKKRSHRKRPMGRTTVMLLIISAVNIISFMPYLALKFFQLRFPDTVAGLSGVEASLFELFIRTHLKLCRQSNHLQPGRHKLQERIIQSVQTLLMFEALM